MAIFSPFPVVSQSMVADSACPVVLSFVSNIPGETQTISLAMHNLIQTPNGGDGIARLALVSLVLALGALIASEWAVRRSAYRRQSE